MNKILFALFISQPIPDYVMESLSRKLDYANPPVQTELVRQLEDTSAVDPCRIMLFNGCKVG